MPDKVTYEVQRVVNLGNYESLRVTVGMTSAVAGEEKTQAAYERIKEEVDNRLNKEVNEIQAVLDTQAAKRK